jgi:hypothetical protein
VTTTRNRDNPDGGDAERDAADPLTPDERAIVEGFRRTCDENDWCGCRAHLALGGEPTKAQREIIRSLVARGLLRLERGGQDEDGQFIGGTFYGVTFEGKWALKWTPQRELPL